MSAKISRALIGGNWKCNGTVAQVKKMIDILNNAGPFSPNSEVVIAAPSIHLGACLSTFRPDISTSAEDCGYKTGYGAYTGEISADMLADFGIKWTLTGHSERRVGFGFKGESSEVVAVKTKNAISKGLSVIACIGEQLADRQNGSTMAVCSEQLLAIKNALMLDDWKRIVIAYEPVWAIGTGVTATPQQAQETHSEIRNWLAKNVASDIAANTRIIYGGSATAQNCNELYSQRDINGFLVGGASLKPEFIKIINCTS